MLGSEAPQLQSSVFNVQQANSLTVQHCQTTTPSPSTAILVQVLAQGVVQQLFAGSHVEGLVGSQACASSPLTADAAPASRGGCWGCHLHVGSWAALGLEWRCPFSFKAAEVPLSCLFFQLHVLKNFCLVFIFLHTAKPSRISFMFKFKSSRGTLPMQWMMASTIPWCRGLLLTPTLTEPGQGLIEVWHILCSRLDDHICWVACNSLMTCLLTFGAD